MWRNSGVLVSYCFCSNLVQTLCLKTTQMYYPTVLEVNISKGLSESKIKMLAGLPSFWKLWERIVIYPFLIIDATCTPWLIGSPPPSSEPGMLDQVLLVLPSLWFSSASLFLFLKSLVITLCPPGSLGQSLYFKVS